MKKDCGNCYKIVCKKCGWDPNNEEMISVLKELMTECPVCGWSPKENTNGYMVK